MNLRPLFLALGVLSLILGAAMIPCALLDYADGRREWAVFAQSAFIVLLIGSCFWLMSRGGDQQAGQREAFLLTVLVWVAMPVVAAVPFLLTGLSLTDAMFEAISGLTTTGATVITGLDAKPRGLLLWRGFITWFGGVGIIVTAIAVLPQLRVGGMQLFHMENTDKSGKFMPSVFAIAMHLSTTYFFLSLLCAGLYAATGMNWFDAVVHMMATVSCGGFSSHDASFGTFADTNAPWVACIFMMISAMPFSLFAIVLLQGKWRPLLSDPQPRLLLILTALIILLVFAYRATTLPAGDTVIRAFKEASFMVASLITGTGFASTAYDSWGTPVMAIILGTTFLGGCAGSAACGIKMFRIEIAGKALISSVQTMTHPHRKAPVRYAGRVVEDETLQSVMVFIFLYFATFLIGSALVAISGVDALSAISSIAASISNVGPGLGPVVGPSGTFQPLNDFATWVNAIAMLLGRLEFVAVFVVLTGRFWRG
jgi:trk system potassium uptake protein TrkH